MKKIIIVLFFLFSYVQSIEIDKSKEYVTKEELYSILELLFPEKIKILKVDKEEEIKLNRTFFPKKSIDYLLKKLKYHYKKEDFKKVYIYCNYLLNNRKKEFDNKKSEYLEVLYTCSNYNFKYLNYKDSLKLKYKLLEENNGKYNNKDILNDILNIYKIQNDKDGIKKIEKLFI